MKSIVLTLALFLVSFTFTAPAKAETEAFGGVCGAVVAAKYLDEVKVPGHPDKYQHCSISCVMALYCGPADAMEIGVLKEVYDYMGFGDPEWGDLKADARGVKIAGELGYIFKGSRKQCYDACQKIYH